MSYTAEMRYTTNLISPCQIRLSDDIKGNRPLVFSRDLVYFVIRKYQKDWRPLFFKNYTIHEMSPLTHSVRLAVDILLRNMDNVYTIHYCQLIEPYGEDRLLEFVVMVRTFFDRFKKRENQSINDLFDILVFVARLSVECEVHGVREAPHLAVVMINLFLLPLQRDVFALFHQHALDIIEICSERSGDFPAQTGSGF